MHGPSEIEVDQLYNDIHALGPSAHSLRASFVDIEKQLDTNGQVFGAVMDRFKHLLKEYSDTLWTSKRYAGKLEETLKACIMDIANSLESKATLARKIQLVEEFIKNSEHGEHEASALERNFKENYNEVAKCIEEIRTIDGRDAPPIDEHIQAAPPSQAQLVTSDVLAKYDDFLAKEKVLTNITLMCSTDLRTIIPILKTEPLSQKDLNTYVDGLVPPYKKLQEGLATFIRSKVK